MGKLNRPPLHPILFAIFPTIFLLSNNIGEITIDQIAQPLILSVILAILVWALINLIIQDRKISAITTSFLLLAFFSYSYVDRLFFWFRLHAGFYLLFMGVSAFLITYSLIKSQKGILKITLILNITAIVILIFPSLNVVFQEKTRIRQDRSAEQLFSHDFQKKINKKPDIYYIVIDSYASNTTLKDYYNFDNSEFVNYLRNKGFYIADKAKANYPFTTPSLASSLNINYLDNIAQKMGVNSQDSTPLFRLTEDNQVALYLKSLGYTYYHFGPEQLPTTFNKNADFNYTYSGNWLTFSPLTGLLLDQTLLSYISSSAECTSVFSVLCIGSLNSRRNHYTYALDQLGNLEDKVGLDGPKFIFYHSLFTHVPFVFAEDGKYVSRVLERTRSWEQNYLNQLKFTNTVLKHLIETILKDSKEPPIIVLQSDEGPYPERFWADKANFDWKAATKDELTEKFGILSAYYLPGVDAKIYPSVTPVNSFRIIFNEYFGEQLQLLDDKIYAQRKYGTPYDFFSIIF